MVFEPKVGYSLLALAVFVIPKIVQRLGVPGAITSLVAGAVIGHFFPTLRHDSALDLLATFGIVALFVVAGFEVELGALRSQTRSVAILSGWRLLAMGMVAWGLSESGGLSYADAALLVVGIMTPSAGFILDSMKSEERSAAEASSIKVFVISSEILSLVLILVLRSVSDLSAGGFAISVLLLSVIVLHWVAKLYLRFILPAAPGSEGGLLMLLAVVMGLMTKSLGLYYITGAFVTGLLAQAIGKGLPPKSNERFLHSVEFFGSLFIPCYFFFAGVRLDPTTLSWESFVIGALFLALALPLRYGITLFTVARTGATEPIAKATALALQPTLVFSIVVGRMLTETGRVAPYWEGALVLYAIGSTLVPALARRGQVQSYEMPHLVDEPPPTTRTEERDHDEEPGQEDVPAIPVARGTEEAGQPG